MHRKISTHVDGGSEDPHRLEPKLISTVDNWTLSMDIDNVEFAKKYVAEDMRQRLLNTAMAQNSIYVFKMISSSHYVEIFQKKKGKELIFIFKFKYMFLKLSAFTRIYSVFIFTKHTPFGSPWAKLNTDIGLQTHHHKLLYPIQATWEAEIWCSGLF